MARMMRREFHDRAYYDLLATGYTVSTRLVTTTPYPVGRMYQPPGSPVPQTEQVHGQVLRNGDTVTVEWIDFDRTVTWDDVRAEVEVALNPWLCQLCWATARWPWEPLRACPVYVDVELTYCARHRP